jgi:pimeloyl-ACP methyl ester carboxylesterase
MDIPHDLYPFTGRKLDVNGHQMHYLDEGPRDAHPVVMVHGNPSWSFYYRELVKALRDTHRCIVPDHIGCGFSDKPPLEQYPYTLDRRVADLGALLDQVLPEGPFTLVVHDWGGMIGTAVASRMPDRVARLVVLNTAAFGLPDTKKLPTRLGLVRDSALGAMLVTRFNAFARGATWMAVTRKKMDKRVADALCAPYDTPDHRIATLRFVQDIPLKPGDPGWETVQSVGDALTDNFGKTPALCVWGDKDFVFDHHFLRVWQEKLPNLEVHRYPDCGHYILEDARDEVIGHVRDFFAAHPVSGEATA